MSQSHDQVLVDSMIAATASKATYTGAGTSVLGYLFSSEFGVLAGIVLGVAGLLVNWYYRHKQHKREQLEHEIRVAQIKEGTHE